MPSSGQGGQEGEEGGELNNTELLEGSTKQVSGDLTYETSKLTV